LATLITFLMLILSEPLSKLMSFSILVNLSVGISAAATAVGILFGNLFYADIMRPRLEIRDVGFWKESNYSLKLYVDVLNKGRSMARDAKGYVTIRKIIHKNKRGNNEVDLERTDIVPYIPQFSLTGGPAIRIELLVRPENPKVEGDLLPWAVPEVPYSSLGWGGIPLKHITNIAPSQSNKLMLLEAVKINGRLQLRIFSEYGTQPEFIKEVLTKGLIREAHTVCYRCVLNPGHYKFMVKVTADQAFHAETTFELECINTKIVVRNADGVCEKEIELPDC